jgi:hypothetical protein
VLGRGHDAIGATMAAEAVPVAEPSSVWEPRVSSRISTHARSGVDERIGWIFGARRHGEKEDGPAPHGPWESMPRAGRSYRNRAPHHVPGRANRAHSHWGQASRRRDQNPRRA